MADVKSGKEALSQQAYRTIKGMILRSELSQGQFISEPALQDMLGIGRTPVREAILQLSRDKLVTIYPRRGIAVARITPKAIRDIFEIRSILEPSALRMVAAKLDRGWLESLRERFGAHADDVDITREDAIKLADLDDEFHAGLIEAMGNGYASDLMKGFMDYLVIIRSTVTTTDETRFHDSNDEHIAIIDAILDGEIDLACGRLSEHISVSCAEALRAIMEASY